MSSPIRRFITNTKVIFPSFVLGMALTILALFAFQLLTGRSVGNRPSAAEVTLYDEGEDERDPIVLPTKGQAPAPPASSLGSAVASNANRAPIYRANDFLTDYLNNRNYPIIVDGTPWNNSSTNVFQYQDRQGGNSYWDFWSDDESWESPNHMYQGDDGKWHTYSTATLRDPNGKPVIGYVMVDRRGPGVMEKLWFTHDTTATFLTLLDPTTWFGPKDPPELVEWGNLSKLGNLRIDVDDQIVYDGPVKNWFSGDAQHLSPSLQKVLVWRFQDFGSSGNIIPIPYQSHLRVLTYGGIGKPKWFNATGVTLPAGSRVQPYTNTINDLALDGMTRNADMILAPEKYLDTVGNVQEYKFNVGQNDPGTILYSGSGTIGALQVRIPKSIDLNLLKLTIKSGNETTMDLPLLAFFGEAGHISLHHSTPIGIIEEGDDYLFYSNFPMPYHSGLSIGIENDAGYGIPVSIRLARTNDIFNTELRVQYQAPQRLQVYGPDYQFKLPGNGKLVGLVLVTQDQELDKVPKVYTSGDKEDPKAKSWPMGYLEGDLTMYDGDGNFRLYAGQEDWTDGGFYFNNGYTAPPGGANRPFGGILEYKNAKDGYATLFRYFNDLAAFRFKDGLLMNFGHGTYRNNFAVKYGVTAYYYAEVPGVKRVDLPAFKYIISSEAGEIYSPCNSASKADC